MATSKKCNTCKVGKEIEKSTEPACCIWYMDNVVLGDKNVNDCDNISRRYGKIERCG